MKRRILIGNWKMHGDGGSLFAMATIASDARQARTTGWPPRKSAPRSLSPVSFGSMIASLDQAGPLVSDQCSIRLQSKRRTEWNSAVRSMKESDDDV